MRAHLTAILIPYAKPIRKIFIYKIYHDAPVA